MIFQRYRCSQKYLARSTIFASTFGALLSFVSSYPPPTLRASQFSLFSTPTRSFRNQYSLVSSTSNTIVAQVRHFASLNNEEERAMARDVMQIIEDAIQAVDPYTVVRSNIVREHNMLNFKKEGLKFDLSKDYDRIVLVAFGKASSAMSTSVLEQIFPKNPADDNTGISCMGVVICKDGHATQREKETLAHHGIEIHEASHPVPDDRSVKAADRLLQMVSSHASDKTLVICCISGGGSSLFCRPSYPLTIDDLKEVNSILLASGMGIKEMNVLRKRLEDGKGGGLAASCFPSHVVALILSDVVDDPLDLIASGPTVPDKSTWQDGWDIVEQYNLKEKLPRSVIEILKTGLDRNMKDSSSSLSDPIFENSTNILVGNNALAVEAASKKAKILGYQPVILGTGIVGEAKEVAKIYTAMSLYLQNKLTKKSNDRIQDASDSFVSYTLAKSLPAALIAGGETTVSLSPKSGKGGRNQELALSAALQLDSLNLRNIVLASVGTDGGDGPTDAAGAVVDATTTRETRTLAIEALSNHNAYPYLDSLKHLREVDDIPPLIKTGPTGTNVADICVTLIKRKPTDT